MPKWWSKFINSLHQYCIAAFRCLWTIVIRAQGRAATAVHLDLRSYYVAPYIISAEPHPQVNFILLHWPYAQGFLHQISAKLLYINQIWLDLNMWHNFSPTRSVTMLGVPFFQNLMITIRNNWQQASSSYICVSQIHMVGIASSRLLHSLLHI